MGNFLNNGQRRPNIFERARAYEDGNEGYVQQQKPKTNIVINTNVCYNRFRKYQLLSVYL